MRGRDAGAVSSSKRSHICRQVGTISFFFADYGSLPVFTPHTVFVPKSRSGTVPRQSAVGVYNKPHIAALPRNKVANIRNNWLHHQTTRLCRENQTVVIEDLNVKGMLGNRRLSRHLSDIGFSEFRRQLTYKSAIYGTNLVVAGRWYPSSKTCSACGAVKSDLTLKDRVYVCTCGASMDRDLNAALNLRALGLRVHACGRLDNPAQGNLQGAESVEAGTNQCPLVGTF